MKNLNDLMDDVREFRQAFGLACDCDSISISEQDLHWSLFHEERQELDDADSDIETLDAIVDSVYVLVGRLVHDKSVYGNLYIVRKIIDNIALSASHKFEFYKAWDIVHASNMSKMCINMDEARETKENYIKAGYNDIDIIAQENYLIVRNASDVTLPCGKVVLAGKTLKSINYIEADLSECV